eukprot:gnl/MRDRNA2_/MRDRNA2_105962_c0_seq1.p1 gnl/MRDRNA2_/MRDRNA2_105962_c0~~gnl/MRDRNA2_/MRDRNA2_105962_c0_seq1.p1  ORF type:complete len:261 (+),score=37.06 gnl/MRDRNA2_/MRDRNA2_105962_c0_seq1:106-783(+)
MHSTIGDLSTQWKWHETFRDTAKNMYRTSYNDMVHGREVSVKSDFPSGYGGHVSSLRHDILFRNTQFDRQVAMMRSNPSRDGFQSFADQIEGIPTYCMKPRGSKKVPTAGTIPNSTCKPPWALTLPLREPPTFRTTPNAGNRSLSAPGFRSGGRTPLGASGAMMGAMTQDLGQHLADANERAMNTTGITEKDMLMANSVAPGVEMQQASYRRSPSNGNLRMGMTM